MTSARRVVTSVVRGWTRVYTWRLPPSVREARRAEVDSDLWEFQHDPERVREPAALHMLARLALGIADDLLWRAANRPAASWPARIVALTGAAALVVAGFWFYQVRLPQGLPVPPARMAFVAAPPPPPVPAPPEPTAGPPVP